MTSTAVTSPLLRLAASDIWAIRDAIHSGQPALITGGMHTWPALARWDHAYLRDATLRDPAPLPLYHAAGPRASMRALDERFPLPEIIDRLWSARPAAPYPEGSIFYFKQQPLQNFPGLLKDVLRPAFYGEPLVEVNLWIGSAGCWTPLHFDFVDNLLCHVRGTRRVWLYSPAQSAALAPAFAVGETDNPLVPPYFSLVGDPRHADLDRFPAFAATTPAADLTLGPGEILYIPPYWWHFVEIVDGPAVAVNFWYSRQYGGPLTTDDNAAETTLLTTLRGILEKAPPARRAAIGHLVHAMFETAGTPPDAA